MATSSEGSAPSALLDALSRTSDGMVAVDSNLRIIGWNEAATRILGFSPDETLGRPCHDFLGWKDRCGNEVCSPDCAAALPGNEDEIFETREVTARSADGKALWLNVTSVVPPPEMREECRVVHLLREVSLPPELERLIAERINGRQPADPESAKRLAELTPREREVLDLLSEGYDGNEIAEKLYISKATVRNHIQRILNKLDVHSRVEAVALNLRA